MAQKRPEGQKRKAPPRKEAREETAKVVLVGTYKGDQLTRWRGWYNYPISEGDFNVGTPKGGENKQTDLLTPNGVRGAGGSQLVATGNADAMNCVPPDFSHINELWLFNGTKDQKTYKAEFVGVKTREELIRDYGYPGGSRSRATAGRAVAPRPPKPHGTHYALFKTELLYRHKNALPGEAEHVIVRTADFARSPKVRSQLKAYLESPDRNDPDLAKQLPSILTRLRPAQLRVCEAAVQLEFPFYSCPTCACVDRKRVQRIIADARGKGKLTCVEICAGAGGQAIGLERAGFEHVALVEYESEYCTVLRNNKPNWNVICADVHNFDGSPYVGVDLLAGGVPCPPFSVASKQLGERDERDLFPEAIRLISEIRPRAVMIENVRGLLDPKFDVYRNSILERIGALGYSVQIKLLQASDYGVPQIRPRVVIVGIRLGEQGVFSYPLPSRKRAPSVGESLRNLMGANGWRGLDRWVEHANKVAPTIVGGSKKHGGPDLGPTRARRAWAELGVDGLGVANEAPSKDFEGMPKLTKEMIAVIQGFPPSWNFGEKKTLACRMIGNAFPPPVANAIGRNIRKALNNE